MCSCVPLFASDVPCGCAICVSPVLVYLQVQRRKDTLKAWRRREQHLRHRRDEITAQLKELGLDGATPHLPLAEQLFAELEQLQEQLEQLQEQLEQDKGQPQQPPGPLPNTVALVRGIQALRNLHRANNPDPPISRESHRAAHDPIPADKVRPLVALSGERLHCLSVCLCH